MRKQFYQTAPGNCYGLKLPECRLRFKKDKLIVLFSIIFGTLSFRIWMEGTVLLSGAVGPHLRNILRQSYDYLTIMPKLRSTYDGRLIYKTSYNEWKAFHRSDSRAKIVISSEIVFVN